MRRIIFVLLLLTSATPLLFGQARQGEVGAGGPDMRGRVMTTQGFVYRLGTRRVTIPPPGGFAEALSQSELLSNLLQATEDPKNELLAAHLPVEVLSRLKNKEPTEFNFYTKVSVSKLAKTHDVTEKEFADLILYFESTSPPVLDINGPVMKSAVQRLRRGLSSVSGTEVPMELGQPQTLGSFEKTGDVYSFMLLMPLKIAAGETPLLCGVSIVKVKRRMLFVYTYRKFTSEKDAEVLRIFTREWVRQILAANR